MTAKDQTAHSNGRGEKKEDQTITLSPVNGLDLSQRLWAYDDFSAVSDPPADFATGLVSLAFIKAAVRRGVRFWCAMTVVGLLAGFGLSVAFPTTHQASTSVLLTFGPYENATTTALDYQAIAQSRAVAGLAMRKLGPRQSNSSFRGSYTVTPLSSRVLLITASAPSSNDAVSRANAVAAAFLQVRERELEFEKNVVLESLNQQISQAREKYNSIRQKISQVSAQHPSRAQQTDLRKLQTQLSQSNTALAAIEQSANGSQIDTATALAVKGSEVLDAAAPVAQTRLNRLVLYPVAGMILGLILGLGIIVVRALISDRLRRRDDVAIALGAPVKLSVGAIRLRRWLTGRRPLAATRRAEVERIVSHLRSALPTSTGGAATLALVPIDEPQVAALSLASLAVECAKRGKQVVVADLCSGAPAAALMGVKDPGVHVVSVHEARLAVAIPDRDDDVPIGPRRPRNRRPRASAGASAHAQPSCAEALADAYASADMLLTLAALDPALGGEHMATWAAKAVVVVTAGKSSATKIHAVGEMLRLAGTHPVSAVLVGADKADESLGVASDAEHFNVSVNGTH